MQLFKKKQPIKMYEFKNVVEKLDSIDNKPLFNLPQKEFSTKEFNAWHLYIRREVKKFKYNDRDNRKSSKQKAK